jgi:hypothetical protein
MKPVKLNKKMLNMHPADLLVKLGATHDTVAYPQHVYFSSNDYKVLGNNLKKKFKKEYPYLNNNKLDYSVGMELLNYGPNESLSEAISPGYALVDVKAIEQEVSEMID